MTSMAVCAGNYGLVHMTDDVYTLLTEEMTRTNARVEAIHTASRSASDGAAVGTE